ncbi:MAG: outer membrane lipoprotein carrier protein LolA, partial [Saprospiraceae bacterium]|nr:outer membrane lipoprotein carrier protein LolA [Saprospiraceae bacterium]
LLKSLTPHCATPDRMSRFWWEFRNSPTYHILTKMNKLILVLIAAILTSTNVSIAQTPAAPEKNDPEAKKVLDKIRKKYDAYKTVEASFTLAIEVPGEQKEVQKGTIAQEDKKFRLDMSDQIIVSDGTTTWAYQKKSNEVQVNNADPSDVNGFLTPKDLLSRYQKGDFLYTITDKTTEGGKLLTQIEFKPKAKNSEYSKLRVAIDEKAGTIQSIKAFAKDGSRYTFLIMQLTPNKAIAASQFTFDTSQFKGVRVEDLRM